MQGSHCGQIVHTGKPAMISQQGFIVPLNSSLTRPLSLGTLWLSQLNMLKTLDQFYTERGPCIVPMKSTITMEKLKIFFISAFSLCFIILLIMIFGPQELGELQSALGDANCDDANAEPCDPGPATQGDTQSAQFSPAVSVVTEAGQVESSTSLETHLRTGSEMDIETDRITVRPR